MSSPFKFLDAYTKEDKDIFFGRSVDIKALFEKIHNGRLLLVYGASGTGKTSLIQCGLANEFQDTDWFPMLIRRNKNILKATVKKIKEKAITSIEDFPLSTKESIIKGFESLYLDFYKPIFLIYDQFEELFISGNDDEILSFFTLLRDILDSNLQIKVILIVREEYLAHLTNMEYVLPELFENRHRVETMSAVNISDVIVSSCETFGISLENKNTSSLIYNKLVGEQGMVALTHLQVFLDRLYKLACKNNPQNIIFSNELISNIGKLEDVLATFLSEQIGLLNTPKHGWQVLKLFITEKGTKKSIPIQEIKGLLDKENIDLALGLSIIKQLAENRVLKRIANNNSYEFSHDSLAKRVFDRLSNKEKTLLEIKQFINQEYTNYKTRNALLSKEDLNYVSPYLKEIEVSNEQKILLEKSRKELNRKKRIFIITTILIISTLSLLTAYSISKSNQLKETLIKVSETNIALEKTLEKLKLEESQKLKAETAKKNIEAKNLMNYVQKLLKNAEESNDKEMYQLSIEKAIDTLKKYPNNIKIQNKLKDIISKYPIDD